MKNNFKSDLFSLFQHKQGGHVQKWLYDDLQRTNLPSGHKLWHNFLAANQNYYPIHAEISLIPQVITALRKTRAAFADTLIDFGVGDEQAITYKALRIARGLPSLSRYTGVDLISDQLATAKKIIGKRRPDLIFNSVISDFYENNIALAGQNKLGMLIGLTISNQPMMENEPFPRDLIIERLNRLRQNLQGNGTNHFLISYDANEDLNAAWEAYNHRYWRRMMLGLVYDLKTRLKPEGNFDPEVWRYGYSINPQKHVVSHVLYPMAAQDFMIDGQAFFIPRKERFVVTNNFKYPTRVFQNLCTDAGFVLTSKPIGARSHSVKFQILEVRE